MKLFLKICSNHSVIIKKIILSIFLTKSEIDSSTECGFSKNDNERLNLELKNVLSEQNYENYSFVKNQEESIIERILTQ